MITPCAAHVSGCTQHGSLVAHTRRGWTLRVCPDHHQALVDADELTTAPAAPIRIVTTPAPPRSPMPPTRCRFPNCPGAIAAHRLCGKHVGRAYLRQKVDPDFKDLAKLTDEQVLTLERGARAAPPAERAPVAPDHPRTAAPVSAATMETIRGVLGASVTPAAASADLGFEPVLPKPFVADVNFGGDFDAVIPPNEPEPSPAEVVPHVYRHADKGVPDECECGAAREAHAGEPIAPRPLPPMVKVDFAVRTHEAEALAGIAKALGSAGFPTGSGPYTVETAVGMALTELQRRVVAARERGDKFDRAMAAQERAHGKRCEEIRAEVGEHVAKVTEKLRAENEALRADVDRRTADIGERRATWTEQEASLHADVERLTAEIAQATDVLRNHDWNVQGGLAATLVDVFEAHDKTRYDLRLHAEREQARLATVAMAPTSTPAPMTPKDLETRWALYQQGKALIAQALGNGS